MDTIEVRLPIKLGQFLKLANIAETGAHARDIIDAGIVYVNDEMEDRRGRTLTHGDIVTIKTDIETIQLRVCGETLS